MKTNEVIITEEMLEELAEQIFCKPKHQAKLIASRRFVEKYGLQSLVLTGDIKVIK